MLENKKTKLISDAQVEQDIAITQTEISQMEREIEGLRLIGDRMSNFRANARISGIAERKEFIKKLQDLLEERKINTRRL